MSVLRFRRLNIRRMPGIHDGGFELSELAGGLNIVFGPNASGKTTTSRALEAAIWPAALAPESGSIEATFELDGEIWSIDLDAGRTRIQKSGAPAGSPNALPAEARDRYCLALHDLLRLEDRGLARAIALESVGGYDLEEAARILAPRTSLSRPKREQEELRAARDRLHRSRGVQERLQAELAGLRDDEDRLARQADLEARLEFLRRVAEYATQSADLREASARVSEFPAVIERISGDEAERVGELRRRWADARARALAADGSVREARRDLERCRLTEEIVGAGEIQALEHEVAEATAIDAETRHHDGSVEEARARLDSEVNRLGGIADVELAARTGPGEIARLRPLLDELQQVRARRSAVDSELRLLGPATPAADRPRLEHGARVLQRWLQLPSGDDALLERTRRLAVAAAVVLIAAGGFFATITLSALLLVVVGAALLGLVLTGRTAPSQRPHIEGEYAELGLDEGPSTWKVDEVRTCLDRLNERVAAARAAEHVAERREKASRLLEELTTRETQLAAEVETVAGSLGLENLADAGILLVLDRLSKLYDARVELERAEAARVKSWEHRSDLLSRANQRLAAVGEEGVNDLVTLRVRVRTLSDRLSAYRKAERELREAELEQKSEINLSEQARKEIDSIFERLGTEAVDDSVLAAWCAQREPMSEARRVRDTLARICERLEADLRTSPLFQEADLMPDLAAVNAEIVELEEGRAGVEVIRDRIARTRAEIDRAMRSHDVEDALAEVDACVSRLREVRERDARAALSAALVDHVERESRNEHRPEVFHRANRLFARITRGRYELRLEDAGEAAFRAFDVQRARSHPLEELSSATRIQLLLAVRIAFVEVQEGGVRLPLLMDETLANSDDDRASAIIDAVLTLAADGRQVFYFTAQPDEVRKWRSALELHPAVESRVLDLGRIRRLQQRLDPAELSAATEPIERVPPPMGHSHASYGELLEVPAVDPLAPPGALHLWYLLEEPEPLHRVITTLGTDTLGGFRNLIENGGEGLLPAELVRRVDRLGTAAEAALRGLSAGRGRPLDRQAILASGAVTEKFVDEVADLCVELGGDAARVLEALEGGAVARFLKKKVEELRDFCLDRGHIDPREPHRPEQIRIDAIREVGPAIERRELRLDQIDRLLHRLGVRLQKPPTSGVQELELWDDTRKGRTATG